MSSDETKSISPSSPDFWDGLYRSGDTGWDLGLSTPVFRNALERDLLPLKGRVLVAGAGKGHDAILFAQNGFEVVAVDFAPTALGIARINARKANVTIDFIQADLFRLSRKYRESFDLLIEYTVFCAIEPGRRGEYYDVASEVLKPGGLFVGLFYPIDGRPGGPPFAVDAAEVEALFSKSFTLVHREIPDSSVKPRMGKEILMIWKKR